MTQKLASLSITSLFLQNFEAAACFALSVRLALLGDYSSLRIGFNMINIHRTLPIILVFSK